MTPLQAFLVLLVIIIFCMIGDTPSHRNEWIQLLGGLCVILEFVVVIWAIFYYL